MGTFITLVVVVGLVGLVVRSMIKDKKVAREAVVVTAGERTLRLTGQESSSGGRNVCRRNRQSMKPEIITEHR